MRRFFPIVALVVLLAGLTPSHSAAQLVIGSPDYGAAAFVLGHPETADRDAQLMVGAGLNWLRLDIPWRSIEASCKNCFDWTALDQAVATASSYGLRVMARIDHPPAWSRAVFAENGPPDDLFDYADFVQAVARRYRAGSPRGTIQAIQVWNEPNLNREWGGELINRRQAVQYMSMLRQTYTLVKEVDPSKIIVSAGLSPTGTNDGTAQPDDVYLTWLYENDLQEYADVIGAHAPGYGSAPEAEPGSNPAFAHPSFYFRRVEQLRNIMVLNGDSAKQMWINEFGWTSDPINPDRTFYAVSEDQKADYIVRAFQYARQNWSPWIGVMFVWNMPDPTWTPASNEQYWWGITEPDGTPRPAYNAIVNARATGVLP